MVLRARCVPRHGKDGAGRGAETWSLGVRCINACGTEPAPLAFTTRLSSGAGLRRCTQHPCSDGCVYNCFQEELGAPALLLRDTQSAGHQPQGLLHTRTVLSNHMGWPGCLELVLHSLLPNEERCEGLICSAAPAPPPSFPCAVCPPQEWDPTSAGSLS